MQHFSETKNTVNSERKEEEEEERGGGGGKQPGNKAITVSVSLLMPTCSGH